MNQIEESENVLSQTTVTDRDNISENLKLVQVSESIRYRKRAQSAEKKAEVLAEQLGQAQEQNLEMAEQLNEVKIEQELVRKLAASGAVDLEAAILIAKSRIDGKEDVDLDGVVKQLKSEKQYLFGVEHTVGMTAQKTSGAKDRAQNSRSVLERAAKRASRTGNRADLQEYLKLRRNFV